MPVDSPHAHFPAPVRLPFMSTDTLRLFAGSLGRTAGAGSLVLASEVVIPRRYTSGSLTLDAVLGGGWPGNQWSEVIGENSSGKTSTVLKTVAANQRLDPEFTVFWAGAEQFEPGWAAKLGVDVSRVVVTSERSMETVLDMMLVAARERIFDMIVLDSYPALIPADEMEEKSIGDAHVAPGARTFNKFWRRMGESGARSFDGTERPYFGIIMNQWRAKVGGWSPQGTPRTTLGGQGKDYAFYARVDVVRTGWITEEWPGYGKPVKVAQQIRYSTIKNKSASPQATGSADFYIRNARSGLRMGSFDTAAEHVEAAVMYGAVIKRGGWYVFGGQKWQGKPALTDAVREDTGLQEAIAAEVLKMAADPSLIPAHAHISGEEDITPPPRRLRRPS